MVARVVLGVSAVVFAGLLGAGCEDLVFKLVDAPCYGSDRDRCRDAQYELQPIARASCEGEGRRVCLVPIGLVSTELIQRLVDQYREHYGLAVSVLIPLGIPPILAEESGRDDQIGGGRLTDYMAAAFPEADIDADAVLIGVTPVDIYFEDREDWRFVFGVRGQWEDPKAVVSTFRMNPETYGKDADDELLFSRASKMVSKYIGMLYYGFPESADPGSPLYDRIFSVDALDGIEQPLPVTPAP